jgi:hypothetical protein
LLCTTTSISPADAGRLLQRVEIAHAAQVLRHQLAQVGVDLRLRVEREPGQREHEPDQQHALRPLERAAQRGLARAAAEPPQRREQAPHAPAQLVDELGRPARRGAERPPPPRRRAAAASAAVPALSARKNAIAMPTTSSTPKPRTIGTGDSSSTRKPTLVASAAVAIVGTAVRAVRRASPPSSSTRAWYWIA